MYLFFCEVWRAHHIVATTAILLFSPSSIHLLTTDKPQKRLNTSAASRLSTPLNAKSNSVHTLSCIFLFRPSVSLQIVPDVPTNRPPSTHRVPLCAVQAASYTPGTAHTYRCPRRQRQTHITTHIFLSKTSVRPHTATSEPVISTPATHLHPMHNPQTTPSTSVTPHFRPPPAANSERTYRLTSCSQNPASLLILPQEHP